MKTLLLFRHADAASPRGYATDHERPLTERGQQDAQAMGRFLAAIDQAPDRVVTSTATRARQTLTHARAGGGWSNRMRAEDTLYEASTHDVLAIVQQTDAEARAILLVGHNPTFTDAVTRLVGGGNVRMATGTIARVDLPVDTWADVQVERGRLRWLIGPKDLPR
jgi:phosphohistidine phosphatase